MPKMPVLFAGHGSPMNAIEGNPFSQGWRTLSQQLPKPRAILSVSAHWYGKGTRVMTQAAPQQIYDFFGFPKALYDLKYPASGAPEAARETLALLTPPAVSDEAWGIDHGTWSVLVHLFPEADVPVFQLSIDAAQPPAYHYALGQRLAPLREAGIMIFGTGNIVHSFQGARFDMEGGHPWAYEFDDYIYRCITEGDHGGVIDPHQAGSSTRQAFQTPDHYYPLLYVLGAAAPTDRIRVFNRACVMGGFSMTGYVFTPEE